jgi:hypothetical protein
VGSGHSVRTGLSRNDSLLASIPFAAGGETTVKNLEPRCRAHNTKRPVLRAADGQEITLDVG